MVDKINIKEILAGNIKQIRESRGLSQEQLAELVGIEPSALSKIESGKSYPNPETIENIIKSLKIAPFLLYVTDKEYNLDEVYEEITQNLKKFKNDKKLIRVHEFILALFEEN